MTVTWIDEPSDITPVGYSAGTWTDIDVSATAPAGTTGVILHFTETSVGDGGVGFRKNGSTDAFAVKDYESDAHGWTMIGVDSSRIFEFFFDRTTGMDLRLVGYTDSDWDFLTNATDYTPGSAATWTDADITADTTGVAVGAVFFQGVSGTTARADFGTRKNGSTDDRHYQVESWNSGFTGVDGDEIAEVYCEDIGGEGAMLLGYCTDNATFNTNAVDDTPPSTSVWTDQTALGSGSGTGGMYEFGESGNVNKRTFGIRTNGGTEAITKEGNKSGSAGMVKADASGIVETWGDHANNRIFQKGYITEPAAGGRIMSSLVAAGGLAGPGGIAGIGGGLAA